MSQPLLDTQEEEIRLLLARHTLAARLRQVETFRRLRAGVEHILVGEATRAAILTRGSLARGDFCSHSDVDLVILATSNHAEAIPSLVHRLALLEPQLGRRISIDYWDERTAVSQARSIGFWLGAAECRFVGGDIRFFLQRIIEWRQERCRISVPKLFALRRLDLRRHWNIKDKYSPLGMNVKRAQGGLVDTDFVRFIEGLSQLDSRQERECHTLFQANRLIRDRLFLVKSLLHDITGSARESALLDCGGPRLPHLLQAESVVRLLDCEKRIIEVLETRLRC